MAGNDISQLRKRQTKEQKQKEDLHTNANQYSSSFSLISTTNNSKKTYAKNTSAVFVFDTKNQQVLIIQKNVISPYGVGALQNSAKSQAWSWRKFINDLSQKQAVTLPPKMQEAINNIYLRTGGRFGIPGGKINQDETPQAAAIRELWEELNLSDVDFEKFSKHNQNLAENLQEIYRESWGKGNESYYYALSQEVLNKFDIHIIPTNPIGPTAIVEEFGGKTVAQIEAQYQPYQIPETYVAQWVRPQDLINYLKRENDDFIAASVDKVAEIVADNAKLLESQIDALKKYLNAKIKADGWEHKVRAAENLLAHYFPEVVAANQGKLKEAVEFAIPSNSPAVQTSTTISQQGFFKPETKASSPQTLFDKDFAHTASCTVL
ncbi:MAG: hypothetical protein Tsb005_18100 [Gammaproteobacteria bacterium]